MVISLSLYSRSRIRDGEIRKVNRYLFVCQVSKRSDNKFVEVFVLPRSMKHWVNWMGARITYISLGLGGMPYFTIYRYWCTDRYGFLLYLLKRYLNVWFVKCDMLCVTSICTVYSATRVIPLCAAFHTDIALSLKERICCCLTTRHFQSKWSMQHTQRCCFHFDLNINTHAFYNYNISLCFLHLQTASLYFLSKLA